MPKNPIKQEALKEFESSVRESSEKKNKTINNAKKLFKTNVKKSRSVYLDRLMEVKSE